MPPKRDTIIDLQPVTKPDGRKTFYPVRADAGDLAEMDAAPLAQAQGLRPPAPMATAVTEGDHVSRAWAFSIRTWQLAALVGFASWIILGKLATGHPLLSLGAVVWLITGVGVVWAGAFLLDWLSSPWAWASGAASISARSPDWWRTGT